MVTPHRLANSPILMATERRPTFDDERLRSGTELDGVDRSCVVHTPTGLTARTSTTFAAARARPSDTRVGIMATMPMTLRLAEGDASALERQAALEGRSQQTVVQHAVREYIERHSRRALLDTVLDAELPRYAETLERLGR